MKTLQPIEAETCMIYFVNKVTQGASVHPGLLRGRVFLQG
jgi:hypothetical protein